MEKGKVTGKIRNLASRLTGQGDVQQKIEDLQSEIELLKQQQADPEESQPSAPDFFEQLKDPIFMGSLRTLKQVSDAIRRFDLEAYSRRITPATDGRYSVLREKKSRLEAKISAREDAIRITRNKLRIDDGNLREITASLNALQMTILKRREQIAAAEQEIRELKGE